MSNLKEDVEKQALRAVPHWVLAIGGSVIVIAISMITVAMSLKVMDFPTQKYFMAYANAYEARVLREVQSPNDEEALLRIEHLEARVQELEAKSHEPSPR